MKYLLVFIAFIFLQTEGISQNLEIGKVKALLKTYQAEKSEAGLDELLEATETLFDNEEALSNGLALYLKAEVIKEQILSPDYESPEDLDLYLDEVIDTYKGALIYDRMDKNRYNILLLLYDVKLALTAKGADYYTVANYDVAYQYYNAATEINEVEIKFPRIARPDTSTIYTAAVVARLAEKDELAMEKFEQVVDLEYYRQDAYDQLIQLYKKNKFDVKARKLEIRKNKMFPPEQN